MSVLATLPSSLPAHPIPQNIDVASVAKSFGGIVNDFQRDHFVSDAIWRDIIALTGSIRCFYSPSSILTAWKETAELRQRQSLTIDPSSARVIRHPEGPAWIECRFTFDVYGIPKASCFGFLSLVLNAEGYWKIWIVRTLLQQVHGLPDAENLEPGGEPDVIDPEQMLDVAVIGGGPAGLSMAGRCKAAGSKYLLVDKQKLVGDNWNTRYESTRLHTFRNFAHLPFERTFTPDYQEFLTRQDLARGYTSWANKFGINIWQDTNLDSGKWHADAKSWTLEVRRAGQQQQLKSRHVILCTGSGGQISKMPSYPGMERFKGVVMHSSEYKHSRDWKGKRGVVIGTANTGHDVADDMLEAGCSSVTMVQRGRTYVLPVEHYGRSTKMLYNDTLPTNAADTAQ